MCHVGGGGGRGGNTSISQVGVRAGRGLVWVGEIVLIVRGCGLQAPSLSARSGWSGKSIRGMRGTASEEGGGWGFSFWRAVVMRREQSVRAHEMQQHCSTPEPRQCRYAPGDTYVVHVCGRVLGQVKMVCQLGGAAGTGGRVVAGLRQTPGK